jgi:CheY-like chemotaxis protein/nitrogen-specific signal transduction histidine kinase
MAKRKAKPPAKRTGGRRRRAGGAHVTERALAAFAHDVRTPLTGIVALGELLATSELGERERRWVEALKGAADHLVALTTLVVDAARAEVHGIVLRNELFDIRAFIDSIAESLSARAAANALTCATDIAADLDGVVVGDPVRLRGAVENLIDNAVKFTQDGTVGLKVTAKRGRGRQIRLEFAVADSGIGMTPAEIKRLFRPFAQASEEVARKFGGAGLGLVLVKRLAQAMGGELKVVSKPGVGSTFRLSVVLSAGPPGHKTEPAAAVPGREAPARGLNILCAEDNPYGRVILRTILKELGHSVEFVGSGDAAVAAVARGGSDLVLMDVTLPSGNGIEATRRIRGLVGERARMPVIGISGLSSPDEEAAARAAGMNDYLAKPVSPAPLAKAIAALV